MSEPTDGLTPTQRWQSSTLELPPTTTAGADTAERLLLLAHYGIDWDSWVADHRRRYWDELLPGRVHVATYRAENLATWWSLLCTSLPITVSSRDRRVEVAQLLGEPSAPVLAVLRDQLPALILRVRIIAEAVSAQRQSKGEAL